METGLFSKRICSFTVIILTLFIHVYSFAQTLSVQKNGDVNSITLFKNNKIYSKVPVSSPDVLNNPAAQFHESPQADNIQGFNWVFKFSVPGKVFKDISFTNLQVGYIVTELGSVYKTTNGGDNWVSVMNLGFPYYWYGVYALSPDTVVISGFNDQGIISTGVIRWSFNGGTSWTNDITLHISGSGVGWLTHIHFFDQNRGVIMAEFNGGVHYTTNGGKDSTAWTYVQVNSDGGWFAGDIDAQSSGNVYATGIHFAKSTNFGVNWTSGPSADNVFDGGVDFLDYNNLIGWTGGGQISAPVSGWVHSTSDGGQTWSQRLNTFPWPIRSVKIFADTLGLAFGGNLYQEAGGIYSSTNAGANWNLDVNTVAEMFSYETKSPTPDSTYIWSVGSTGGSTGFTGKLYEAKASILTGINIISSEVPHQFVLYQNYPNPFNPGTTIKFDIPQINRPLLSQGGVSWSDGVVSLKIYDILGREVASLINTQLRPGIYSVTWKADNFPSGIYFYKLSAGQYTQARSMILLK
jgi:photosystem II stability/assembly factor-like uncharacterized protein